MKKILHLLLFLNVILIFPTAGSGQNYTISVSGVVTDIENGAGIPGQKVTIEVFGAGMTQTYEIYTNDTGYYYQDSIIVIGTGTITVRVYDCNEIPVEQQANYNPQLQQYNFDFSICNPNSTSCEADFVYSQVPGTVFSVMFADISTGNPDQWYWDFGDGNSSTEQNPVHNYNSIGPFLVCLTIWADSGFCTDTTCHEINNDSTMLGCTNWFFYETTDSLTFDFSGGSLPEAQSYFWDFGDGATGNGQFTNHTYLPLNDSVQVILTTITTEPTTGDSCVAITSQTIWVGSQSSGCTNWFDYTTPDNLTFNFTGYSQPPAIDYLWDFGDGTTGSGSAISHTYNTGSPGFKTVTLTTNVYGPAGGDTCTAVSDQQILVGNNTPCNASFTWQNAVNDPFTVYFTDNSTGLITSRSWDFGDGTGSVQTNPVHTYAAPGEYEVCLSILSDSLGFICTDSACDILSVNLNLNAAFTIVLDTLSGLQRNYFFYDNSTGDPDSFHWDFGDGSTSTEVNPQHQYSETGNYNVCLSISKNFPNATTIYDTACQQVEAPQYFNLGGTVFLGDYPMNNINGDTTIVDTGIVYLYRKYANAIVPADTATFQQFGYYWFSGIRAGNYIVKAGLTEGSENYKNWLPAYHTDHMQWTSADLIGLNEGNSFDNSVNLVPLAGTESGPGTINGTVSVSGYNGILQDDLAGIDVILSDASGIQLDFAKTNADGQFQFSGLALSSYMVLAESAGYYTYAVIIDLNETQPLNTVELELYTDNVGIGEQPATGFEIGDIYPNPVKEKLFVSIISGHSNKLLASLFNLQGQLIISHIIQLTAGENQYSINVSSLQHGLYYLQFNSENHKSLKVRKFIK